MPRGFRFLTPHTSPLLPGPFLLHPVRSTGKSCRTQVKGTQTTALNRDYSLLETGPPGPGTRHLCPSALPPALHPQRPLHWREDSGPGDMARRPAVSRLKDAPAARNVAETDGNRKRNQAGHGHAREGQQRAGESLRCGHPQAGRRPRPGHVVTPAQSPRPAQTLTGDSTIRDRHRWRSKGTVQLQPLTQVWVTLGLSHA